MSVKSQTATRRIRLTISYDGTAYSGWQRQLNAPSVQAMLEKALFSLTSEHTCVTGASRTDAGVHALGQTAHFDTCSRIPDARFPLALNAKLPPDIRITDAQTAAPAFHARYSARGKTYRYQIHNGPYGSALFRNLRAHVVQPLDTVRMHAAAQTLKGEHDFRAFAAAGSEAKTTIRDIWRADVSSNGELVELIVEGRSFLYNMVRIIAGTLIYIGIGKLPESAFVKALETGNRLDLGITAPARGLTLMNVYYDEDENSF